MNRIKSYLKNVLENIFLDTNSRLCVQLRLFCAAAGVIAFMMTVLNYIKAEYMLGTETGIATLLAVAIYIYVTRTNHYLAGALSGVLLFLVLLTVFLLSGAVEGFAALWFCLFPFICLFVLDMESAILFTAIGLAVLVVFLWTPLNCVLPPVYTQNFLLRFPFLYIGNSAFALALNGFYSYTYNRLLKLNRMFERLSNQDGLTGLSNRTYLEKYQKDFLDKGGGRLAAVMLDVDFFKQYNDTYGHLAGDEVLKTLAKQIIELLPDENSVGVRYGGEEFLVLLPGCDEKSAAGFARSLLESIRGLRIPHTSGDGYLSASVGVSSRDIAAYEGFLELLKQADGALYRAKQNGRNGISVS